MRATLVTLLPLLLATTATAENPGKLSRGAVGQPAARHLGHKRWSQLHPKKRTTYYGGYEKEGEATGGDGSGAGGYGYKGGKKCKHRPSPATPEGDAQPAADEPAPTSDAAEPTPTPSDAEPTAQPTEEASTTEEAAQETQATEEASSTSAENSEPTAGSGSEVHNGLATYYHPIDSGVPNACGGSDDNDESWVIAVDKDLFDSYPGATGATVENPICGKKVKIWYEGQETTATISDRCATCGSRDNIDLTPAMMRAWVPDYETRGRVSVTWQILD